jgi:hypothetical protein
MPMLETPDEMADALADLFGIYGVHGEGDGAGCDDIRRACRGCFVPRIAERMRNAVDNERCLDRLLREPGGGGGT